MTHYKVSQPKVTGQIKSRLTSLQTLVNVILSNLVKTELDFEKLSWTKEKHHALAAQVTEERLWDLFF